MITKIIGREKNSDQPRIQISTNDHIDFLGKPGIADKSISREHCRIIRQDDGSLYIENIKPGLCTYVNGLPVEKKIIKMEDRIELGKNRLRLDLSAIFEPPKDLYSINHLESIWNNFQKTKLEMQIKERRWNAIRSGTGLLSLASMLCVIIPGMGTIRYIFLAISLLLGVYFFIVTLRSSSKIPEQIAQLDEQFHDDYVCPNPKCRRFLGYMPYKDIQKIDSCPVCKVKYTDKEI